MKKPLRHIQITRSKKRSGEDTTEPSMAIFLNNEKRLCYEFQGTRHQQASLLLTLATHDLGFQHALRMAHSALLKMQIEQAKDQIWIDKCQTIINGDK